MKKFDKIPKWVCRRLYTDESTIPGAGFGLFAGERIKKGQNISRYWGRVVDMNESDNSSVYLLDLEDGRGIDAIDSMDCPARYANDARGEGNNAQFVHSSGVYIYMVATRDIEEGEEIFVDYGPDYWIIF